MSVHFLPAGILATAILTILLMISIKRNHTSCYLISGIAIMASILSALYLMSVDSMQDPLFSFNKINSVLSLLLLIIVSIIWIQLFQWLEKQNTHKEEYYLLLLLTTLGGTVILNSHHFASFFIGLELMSLSFIGLIVYGQNKKFKIEAAIKYLILSALASAIILMGIALLYVQFGSLSFSTLAQVSHSSGQGLLLPDGFTHAAGIFILTGLFFKLSLVPCHLWVADLFEGAPLPTTAMLATLSKLAAFIILWRLLSFDFWYNSQIINQLLIIVAITSMLVGNFLALLQNKLLRLLAYSSIAHFGYLLIVILLRPVENTSFISHSFSTETLFIYLIAYLITLIGVFSVLMQLPKVAKIQDLRGLFWHKPSIAITLSALILSLAGIPLTIGFMGKFYIVLAAVNNQLWWLLSALVLGSVVGLFYYLRIIMQMLQLNEKPNVLNSIKLNVNHHVLNLLIIFLVVGFGTFPHALSEFIIVVSTSGK